MKLVRFLADFLVRHFAEFWKEFRRQVVSKYFWRDVLVVFFGITLYAIGFSIFVYPQRVTTGGLSGFCNLIMLSTGMPIDIPYNIINIGLLVITFLFLDKDFFIKTMVGVIMLGILIRITTRWVVPDPNIEEYFQLMVLQDNPVMALILGSIMTGLGLGLVFSVNGCTGGTDVIVALLNKYKNVSLGRLFLIVDGSIVVASFFVNSFLAVNKLPIPEAFDKLVYSVMQVIMVSMTLDWYIRSNKQSVQFVVISSKSVEIARQINAKLNRGCTLLSATGAYSGQPQKVVLVVVRKRQSVALSRLIEDIDPNAFVSQGDVKGVYGQGFDNLKKFN